VTVVAATTPEKIASVATVVVASAVDVSWVAPDKRGSDITSYTAYVLDSVAG